MNENENELETNENEEILETPEVSEVEESSEEAQETVQASEENTEESSEEEDFSLELDYLEEEKQEEKLWQARTGLNFDGLCGAIETIIFMCDRPVALNRIKKMIDEDMPLRVLHEALSFLQEEYEKKHHGIRLLEVAEGYQFRTKATYSKYVQDLFKVNSLVLSPTALEVLAIIAYKQPVSKIEVDKIRGVDSSHIVRALMDKRLVKVSGRSEELGRPVLYGTTPEFLEVFNLPDISYLPPEHELDSMAEDSVGEIADIKSLVTSGDKEKFVYDELEEVDKLSESIKLISSDTPFTKSLKQEDKKRHDDKGIVAKSAFELLEEFVNLRQVTEENEKAGSSELPTPGIDPQIIHDLTAGPFNEPDGMEDEDFEMIDLDTGLPIEQEVEAILEDQALIQEEELFGRPQADTDGADDSEKVSLAQALDDAFEKLSGETLSALPEVSPQELEASETDLEEKSSKIDDLADDMVEEGKVFDLDLSFLNEEKLPEDTEPNPDDSEI